MKSDIPINPLEVMNLIIGHLTATIVIYLQKRHLDEIFLNRLGRILSIYSIIMKYANGFLIRFLFVYL